MKKIVVGKIVIHVWLDYSQSSLKESKGSYYCIFKVQVFEGLTFKVFDFLYFNFSGRNQLNSVSREFVLKRHCVFYSKQMFNLIDFHHCLIFFVFIGTQNLFPIYDCPYFYLFNSLYRLE